MTGAPTFMDDVYEQDLKHPTEWYQERIADKLMRESDGKLTRDAFRYDAEQDSFTCPEGHELKLRGINQETRVKRYKAPARACRDCPIRPTCTDAPYRTVIRLLDEEARDLARSLTETDAYQVARARRKKVEMLFAHMKRHLKMTRLRLRGLTGAAEEFLLTATAQNLKRLVKLA